MTDFVIGGYGPDMDGTGAGIMWGRSASDGRFTYGGLVAELPSPSWLLPRDGRVYAALEGTGELAKLTWADGVLTESWRVPSGGDAPCHLASAKGAIVVACYGDGTVAVHRPAADPQLLPGSGSGPRSPRQDGPHAHHVLELADGRVLSVDLGADAVHVHAWRGDRLERVATAQLSAGFTPRDLLELADGRVVVLAELSGFVATLAPAGDTFELVHTEALAGFEEGDHGAGVALVHGRFLVAGLRGSNRLTTLEVAEDGLHAITAVPTAGDWPRHLLADGGFVHVANQRSSTITTFDIDASGVPRLAHDPVAVPSPTCLAAVSGRLEL